MKKILSIIVSILTLFSMLCIPASAESNTDDLSVNNTVTFNNRSYSNLSKEELFTQKLAAVGISEDYYEVLSKKMFDDICNAQTISTKSSYYVESNDGSSLHQTTKDLYDIAVKEEKEKLAQKSFDINATIQGRSSGNSDFSKGVTGTVNKGTLNIVILLVSNDNINFVCSAIFQWETMPSARHTDAFGLARDDNTLVDAHSANGMYTVSYTRSQLSGIDAEINEYHETTEFDFDEVIVSPDGYAIEVDLREDVASNSYPYTTILYTEMIGMVMYEGCIVDSSRNGANHWAVYAHKKLDLVFNGIDFSLPISTGFSINWEWTYEQKCDEHTWERT